MIRDTAWLLRRYRDHACSDWRIRDVLDRQFHRLVEQRQALNAEVDELRRSAPESLRQFDSATDLALQYLAEQRFDSALQEIRKAGTELAELRRFAEIGADLKRAAEAIGKLEDLLDSPLLALASIRILRRLRDLARQLLDQREARKARFVVHLLRDQTARLKAVNRKEPNPGLVLLLAELEIQGGEEATGRLRELMLAGYIHLAERLAEDLEADLAVKDRKKRAAKTPGGSLGPLIQNLDEIDRQATSVRNVLLQWLGGASLQDAKEDSYGSDVD